jgi:hypothetical protein
MDEASQERLRAEVFRWQATPFASDEARGDALRSILSPYMKDPDTVYAAWEQAMAVMHPYWTTLHEVIREASGPSGSWVVEQGNIEAMQRTSLDTAPSESSEELPEPQSSVPTEEERTEEYLHGYHPAWLKRDLVDDDYPWHAAQQTSLARFLDQYTLHDSLLVGLWLIGSGELVAIVRWDPVWVNFERIRVDFSLREDEIDPAVVERWGDDVAFWPYILIRFPAIYRIEATGNPDDPEAYEFGEIYSAVSEPLSSEERDRFAASYLPPDQHGSEAKRDLPSDIVRTVIQLRGVYQLQLVHGPTVRLLSLNRAGRVLRIPDLAE